MIPIVFFLNIANAKKDLEQPLILGAINLYILGNLKLNWRIFKWEKI